MSATRIDIPRAPARRSAPKAIPEPRPADPRARAPRRADIQGLRAVAILLVVAYHAGVPIVRGFVGVDIFFAISGFVITGSLLAELRSTGRVSLARFYARRVKRLLPGLAVMLTFVAVVGTVASPVGAQKMGAVTGIWASIFGANVYLSSLGTGYFDPSVTLNPLLHTWTLAVEEQFYLVFPLVLFAVWRLGRTATGLAIGVLSVSSLALMIHAEGSLSILGVSGSQFAFFASPTRAWEFGAGALVAIALSQLSRLPLLAGAGLAACGLGLVAAGAAPAVGNDGFRVGAALFSVLGGCALLAAGSAPDNALSRLLGRRPLVWIGNLSYSWYLWHWPLIVFARSLWPDRHWVAPAAAGVSLGAAWLSYRFVENPIRRDTRRRGRAVVVLAAACVIVPLGASAGLIAVRGAMQSSASIRTWNRAERLHADVLRGCNDPTPLADRKPGSCVWTTTNPRGTIALVGDSNAGQFTEPFVRAAGRARYDALVTTFSSCPFVDLKLDEGTGTFGTVCRRFVVGTLAALIRARPSLVVVAARSDGYVEGSVVRLGAPRGKTTTNDPAAKARLWRQGVHSIVARLGRAGVPVLVVHAVPELPADSPSTAVVRILRHVSPRSISRAAADRRLRRAAVAETTAVAAVPGAAVLDFENAVCNRTSCSSTHGGHFMYRDGEHLSIEGALTLSSRFYAAIAGHARPQWSVSSSTEPRAAA